MAKGQLANAFTRRQPRRAWWRSVRISEWLVFVNGLVLTAAAFLTLLAFIQEIRTTSFTNQTSELRKAVAEDVRALEGTMALVVADLSHGVDIWGQRRLSLAPSFADGRKPFERLAVLDFRFAGGAQLQDLVPITSDTQASYLKADVKQLQDIALKNVDKTGRSRITEVPESLFDRSGRSVKISDKALLLVTPVITGGQVTHIVVGYTRLSRLLEGDVWNDAMSLDRLVIRFKKEGGRLYMVQDATPQDHFLNHAYEERSFTLPVFDHLLDVDIQLREDRKMAFLSKLPFSMLIFGLTLTFVGTLYIRNNRRASVRLSVMNGALSEKNIELKEQIDESNRLFTTLQKSEREYRAIIDGVSDIIFECDSTGIILFLNATWEKVVGDSVSNALGRDIFTLIDARESDELRRLFVSMVAGVHPFVQATTRMRTLNGGYKTVDLSFNRVRHDDEQTIRVLGTITDVDARRRAETALAETEKKYKTIVENAAGGIYQVTPEGVILSANPAMARILGFASVEQLLHDVTDIGTLYLNSRDRMTYERDIGAFGAIKNFETRLVRADGNQIWVSENARAVRDESGHILYYEGSMEDITARVETSKTLQQAKVQSDLANRAKSDFISNMSHELRTPLNAIIGFSEILKTQAMGPLGIPEYNEYAKEIHESGVRLMTTINDILDISKIEAGERALNDTLFSLNKITDSSVKLMANRSAEGKVTIINQLRPDLPKLIGEELAFKQIITNLLSNAVKFTPAGGQVTITCEYEGAGRELRILITDTGIGMDQKDIPRAMAPFVQLDNELSRNNSGTGLGLTLVDSLVRLHGGRLEIISQKGLGTTVCVVVPARRVAVNAPAEAAKGNVTDIARYKGAESR